MAFREKIEASAAPHLQPGESIQVVIPAQAVHPMLYIPGIALGAVGALVLMVILRPFRVVVVTDQRIMVCRLPRIGTAKIEEVLEHGPRSTELGPPHGPLNYKCTKAGSRKLYIPRRSYAKVREADALRPAA